MKAILVSNDSEFTENLKIKLKSENISLRSVKYINNLNIQFLYSNFDIVIIDSKLKATEIYETYILLQNHPNIKFLILHRSDLRQIHKEENEELNYAFLVPYYNFGNLGPIIRWINTEYKNEKSKNIVEYADISLDRKNFIVKRKGKIISLSKIEFCLLEYLLINHDITIKREMLISRLWNDENLISFNTIDCHIHKLRKKIEKKSDTKIIHTIRGIGYKVSIEE